MFLRSCYLEESGLSGFFEIRHQSGGDLQPYNRIGINFDPVRGVHDGRRIIAEAGLAATVTSMLVLPVTCRRCAA